MPGVRAGRSCGLLLAATAAAAADDTICLIPNSFQNRANHLKKKDLLYINLVYAY